MHVYFNVEKGSRELQKEVSVVLCVVKKDSCLLDDFV